MKQVAEHWLTGVVDVLVRPEAAEGMATFSENYYDALVAKGFSKEDAMRIVVAHAVPRLLQLGG